MTSTQKETILALLAADSIELQSVLQELWSGYGQIQRYKVNGSSIDSIIVKQISLVKPNDHPRGWNTNVSHQRKLKSYQIELAWYRNWAESCKGTCRVPALLYSQSDADEILLVMEDLDAAGFPRRRSNLQLEEAKRGLRWLAQFHALFMEKVPIDLWPEGSYWQLGSRADEWEAMAESKLKEAAGVLDQKLAQARYRTIIHGDAKVANFCFSEDMQELAAVDFQYVGGGCGMKDVVYFLGSCLSEEQCEKYQEELLQTYFDNLHLAMSKTNAEIDASAVEKEWRGLYAIAWTDFSRFLMGWMPEHKKINRYSKKLINQAFQLLAL